MELTNDIRSEYKRMAGIYNRNLKHLRTQSTRQEVLNLMCRYKANDDSHLAKILMLNGIEMA